MFKKLLIIILCYYFPAASAAGKTIVVVADSLSAGYGISIEDGWVSLLQERLTEQGYNYRVVNASVSGDTTRSALARLDRLLDNIQPEIAIIELGGNDGLRGLPVAEIFRNLAALVQRLIADNVQVLLIPMQLPPNFGKIYTTRFQQVYTRLSATYDIVQGRFILNNIGDNPELMQTDGIHPKAEAQGMMLENIWPDLELIMKGTR